MQRTTQSTQLDTQNILESELLGEQECCFKFKDHIGMQEPEAQEPHHNPHTSSPQSQPPLLEMVCQGQECPQGEEQEKKILCVSKNPGEMWLRRYGFVFPVFYLKKGGT